MKHNHIVSLFLVITSNLLSIDLGVEGYQFTSIYADSPVQVGHKDLSRIAIERNREGREVCKAARSNVGMDSDPTEDTGFYYVRLNTRSIKYPWVSVLVCFGEPVLYLLPDPKSLHTYTIVIDKHSTHKNNEEDDKVPMEIVEHDPIPCSERHYIENQYTVEVVERDPISCSEMLSKEPRAFDLDEAEFESLVRSECRKNPLLKTSALGQLRESALTSALGQLRESALTSLCAFAIQNISRCNPEIRPQPILSKRESNAVVIIGLETKNEESVRIDKRVALACATSPHIYILFKNLRVNRQKVFLVVNGSQTTPST